MFSLRRMWVQLDINILLDYDVLNTLLNIKVPPLYPAPRHKVALVLSCDASPSLSCHLDAMLAAPPSKTKIMIILL